MRKLKHPPGDGAVNPAVALVSTPGVAIVTLDEADNVITAGESCHALFDWPAMELVGQNLSVLVKINLDLQKFLQQHRRPQPSKTPSSLRVIARRRNGTEFLASISTVTWKPDAFL